MEYVTDTKGTRYELEKELGTGGQGTVYAVKGGNLAVKLLRAKNDEARSQLSNRLSFLRRLDLASLCVARPIETLRPPHVGYVMERLKGMVPLRTLMSPPKGKSSVSWYIESGGLRRRLRLLGRIAHIFSVLHGKSLAYSDPSPANIFVSEKTGAEEAWLIDADNLQNKSSPGKSVYTARYAAPEIFAKKSGVNTLSDAFAFAIVAFETLTLAHPFIGDMVHDGPPELEEEAFSGKLPWIFDTNDDRNRSSRENNKDLLVSPLLFKTFEKMFGAGRDDPCKRPGMSDLKERLFTAADATLMCPECRGTYFYNVPICPWCGKSATHYYLVMRFLLWDPEKKEYIKDYQGKEHVVSWAFSSRGETFLVDRRLALGTSESSMMEPVLSVFFDGDTIRMKSLDENEYRISFEGGQKLVVGKKELSLDVKEIGICRIHFSDDDALHRVLYIRRIERSARS